MGAPVIRAALLMGVGAWFAVAAAAVVLAVAMMPLLGVLVVAGWLYTRRPAVQTSGNFGTAKWASVVELAAAGMIETKGLPLGKVIPLTVGQALRLLWSLPWNRSEQAVRLFVSAWRKTTLWASVPRFTHAVAFAGSGKGKTTGLILPYLLTCNDSCVCIDVKGELTRQAFEARQALGQTVVVFDLYRQVVDVPDAWNPLDLFDPDDPNGLDNAFLLAKAIIPPDPEEREKFWSRAAELWLAAAIAVMLLLDRGDPHRHLQTAFDWLSSAEGRANVLRVLRAAGGLYARLAGQLESQQDKTLASILAHLSTHLQPLSTPGAVDSTTTSSWDVADLIAGKATVFLVVPPERLSQMSGLLRLWITALVVAITRAGTTNRPRVRFLLDEAAALGKLDVLDNVVSVGRGYGLSCLFMYQSMGQLRKNFDEGQDQTFLSNMDVQIFFGITDLATAQYVSDRLGEGTVVNVSRNAGNNTGRNRAGQFSESEGESDGWSAQEGARRLLRAEEVLSLSEREAVVFAPGVDPLTVGLVRNYEPEFAARDSSRVVARKGLRLALGFVLVAALVSAAALFVMDARPGNVNRPNQWRTR